MQDAFAHCEALVRSGDKDRFVATLFAPAEHRRALYALYAFALEVRRIGSAVSAPLPGELRLQWWDEVLAGTRGPEAAGNPVAAALLETVAAYGMPTSPLRELVSAHSFDLYDDPIATLAELDGYAAATSATLLGAAFAVLGGAFSDVATALARHAGIAQGVAATIAGFPTHRLRGRFVPRDVAGRHGLGGMPLSLADDAGPVRAALAELRLHVRGHLAAARDLLPAAPPAVLPALLPVALVRPLLARMERPGYDAAARVDLPQWRRQWTMWRAARRGPHMLD